jgi:hypothetical protein
MVKSGGVQMSQQELKQETVPMQRPILKELKMRIDNMSDSEVANLKGDEAF